MFVKRYTSECVFVFAYLSTKYAWSSDQSFTMQIFDKTWFLMKSSATFTSYKIYPENSLRSVTSPQSCSLWVDAWGSINHILFDIFSSFNCSSFGFFFLVHGFVVDPKNFCKIYNKIKSNEAVPIPNSFVKRLSWLAFRFVTFECERFG